MEGNDEILDKLISEGESYKYAANSANGYTRASTQLLAWLAKSEDYIITHQGSDSAAHNLYKRAEIQKYNGYDDFFFEQNQNYVIGSLKACKGMTPKKLTDIIDADLILENIFNKFHAVVRQMRVRHDNRPTIDVKDEYDVQDILHSILKLNFNDIRSEEWTPSYAGASSRMDFLLKDEKIVIEVKMTRKGLADKDLGKQLIEDVAKYKAHQDCKKLICFTYDPEGRIMNPSGLEADLNSSNPDLTVKIIIKP